MFPNDVCDESDREEGDESDRAGAREEPISARERGQGWEREGEAEDNDRWGREIELTSSAMIRLIAGELAILPCEKGVCVLAYARWSAAD